jgi:hypothetical protein
MHQALLIILLSQVEQVAVEQAPAVVVEVVQVDSRLLHLLQFLDHLL